MNTQIQLNNNSNSIIYLKKRDKRLAKVIDMIGDITYSIPNNYYEQLVESIISQMLANKVATVLRTRLKVLCNGELTPLSIASLSDDEIKQIGISRSKVAYIRNLTEAIESGAIDFFTLQQTSNDEIIKMLTSIRGIGNWSAKMFLIFVLDRQNILPYEDMAFLQSYAWLYKTDDLKPSDIIKKCKKWSPYSSIAARYLYIALDSGLTKEPFHLFI